MTERLMELRKTLTHACDLDEHDQEWIDIIDRLAAIERQVLWRTEDIPEWARDWRKWGNGDTIYTDGWSGYVTKAPDYRPDEPGPLLLPILDPPEGV